MNPKAAITARLERLMDRRLARLRGASSSDPAPVRSPATAFDARRAEAGHVPTATAAAEQTFCARVAALREPAGSFSERSGAAPVQRSDASRAQPSGVPRSQQTGAPYSRTANAQRSQPSGVPRSKSVGGQSQRAGALHLQRTGTQELQGARTQHARRAGAQPSGASSARPALERARRADTGFAAHAPTTGSSAPTAPRPPWDPSIGGRLDGLLASVGGGAPPPARPPDQRRLMAALPGRERPTPHGSTYVLESLVPFDSRHGGHALSVVCERDPGHAAVLAKDNGFELFEPRGALFFDLETTGLSTTMGTLPFLIGAAHLQGQRVVLEQWLLREPDEEAAALTDLARRIADSDWLVSFNGRSFDWPLLQARFRVHGMDVDTSHLLGHFDLLLVARRLVRHAVPDCKLTTLEAHLLGLRRVDDIPGSKVPATYHDYLRGGATAPLVAVVQHNRDDILSMLTLLGVLLDRVERVDSWALRDPVGAQAVAKAALSVGRLTQAEQAFTALAAFEATEAVGQKGLAQVARRRKKAARWRAAAGD